MTGSSIFEYIHENDHSELTEQLGLSVTTNNNNTTTNSGMTSPSSFNEETTGNGFMSLLLIRYIDFN
jgi:neuronal PAS domain-containing protein 1/3